MAIIVLWYYNDTKLRLRISIRKEAFPCRLRNLQSPRVLEPSESFRERKKISEVEADLRAYFAWEIGKPLPGWIYDKLDMFPHLRRHACGFLSFLRTTTSSFNEQERSLYDIMIDCMITDLLMIALAAVSKRSIV